jgi:hypothetical protein
MPLCPLPCAPSFILFGRCGERYSWSWSYVWVARGYLGCAFQAVSNIRHAVFIAAHETMYVDDGVLKVPQQSDTRWVCKYVGVQYFQKRFASMVKALDDLPQSSNKNEATEAKGLKLQCRSFDVVFFHSVFEYVLGTTNGLMVIT